jgi:citrate lyase beta subunit
MNPILPDRLILKELSCLDKIIRDCEDSVLLAERLKARNRWKEKWDDELTALREKWVNALRERDWLDGAMSRHIISKTSENK